MAAPADAGKISQALTRLFEKQRLVFWYDDDRELREEFEALELPDVTKLEIANNEFQLKYRVLREEPDARFLLYHEGPEPPHLKNWLLDVQLAYGRPFRTDRNAMWASELNLPPDQHQLVAEHAAFFQARERRQQLGKLLEADDSAEVFRLKLLAVCTSAQPRIDEVLESLLAEHAAGQEAGDWKLLQRSGLEGFFWEQLQQVYGYSSETPGLRDFVLELFKDTFLADTDPAHQPVLSSESRIFLQRWKDSMRHADAFAKLAERSADDLQIEDRLQQADWRELLDSDSFRQTDQKIVHGLVQEALARTIAPVELERVIRMRRSGKWFKQYEDVYQAVHHAVLFFQLLEHATFAVDSFADGVRKYTHSWYQLDQHYRKFIDAVRGSGQASLLSSLAEDVENRYLNVYLHNLGISWQKQVDAADAWEADGTPPQRQFFSRFVNPFLERNNKVCVIISDAFRYEIAEEFQQQINGEDRFAADLTPMLGSVPSYTQLGMAALLPHREITLADDGNDVIVDGMSARGTANREQILRKTVPTASAVQAPALLEMTNQEARALFKGSDVIYVYQNRIDDTGDKRSSEGQVFSAVRETISELHDLIKKLANANASNILITADHGFLYQHRELAASDFIDQAPEGDEVLWTNRRFVLGRGLKEHVAFRTFTEEQLGLKGGLQVQIPKAGGRLRIKGAGSRYVHGGTTPQETVIPVLTVNKSRRSDIGQVGVEVIGRGSRVITTGQLAVVLYQREPASPKMRARTLRVGLYSTDGQSLSDTHILEFDLTAEDPRERELPVSLILSRAADDYNGREVELRLEEPISGTSHYQKFKTMTYTVRRSFTSDFDF